MSQPDPRAAFAEYAAEYIGLEFVLKRAYSKDRYFPANALARALVDVTGRKCLKDVELARLRHAGFQVTVRP